MLSFLKSWAKYTLIIAGILLASFVGSAVLVGLFTGAPVMTGAACVLTGVLAVNMLKRVE